MYAILLATTLLQSSDKPLDTLELSVIGSPYEIRAHRARIITGERIQELLRMTEEQRANCALLKDKIEEDLRDGGHARTAGSGRASIVKGVFRLTFDENDRGVDELLNDEQLRRLGQIQLQALGPWAVFRLNCVAGFLELTEEQRLEAEKVATKMSNEYSETVKNNDPKRVEAVGNLAQKREEMLLGILSPLQKRKLEELLGEPQDASWMAEFLAFLRNEPRHSVRSYFADRFLPFRLLFSDPLLEVLEVTASERERLRKLVADERAAMKVRVSNEPKEQVPYSGRIVQMRKQYAEDVARHWRNVNEVVGGKRVKRIKEAWLQVRGLDEVYSASETAEVLRVSPEQHKQFSDFFNLDVTIDRSLLYEKAASILTEAQREKFAKLKGEPFPPRLLTTLAASRAEVNCDEFGIPTYGIGSP